MRQARKHWLMIAMGLITLLALTGASTYQVEPTGDVKHGASLYYYWDTLLQIDLIGEINPLWKTQDFNQEVGPVTWRCSSCHGWDYRGAEGAYGPGSPHYTGFPGILSATSMSKTEIEDWLDGTNDQNHDFSEYLTVAAVKDLTAFLQYGIMDFRDYLQNGSLEETGRISVGEDLYKKACRDCHGSDGAKINFGTAEQPSFLGNFSDEEPWHMVHLMRFGHLFLGVQTSDELGWSIQNLFDVVVYSQQLPKGQQIAEAEQQLIEIDYESQADMTNLVILAIVMSVIVIGAVAWVSVRERAE